MPLQECSGGLGVCRTGRAGAGVLGTLQDDGHSCVTTGVLRRTGGVEDWPSRGRGTGNAPGGWSQLCQYRGAQEHCTCAGLAEQGAGGPGTFQDDRHSCVTTGVLRRTGGRQGQPSRGQVDRELSRRMVTVISLCGSMCHCDRALARLEMTGWERAVSLKS